MPVAERLADHLHPALAALAADPSGEAAFWERVAAERAPLIEPDPDQPGYSLVTYVFPAPADVRHVAVQAWVGEARDNVMDHIAGTNVLHATYRYRNDVRLSYSFSPDVPLRPYDEATQADLDAMRAYNIAHPPQPDPHHREHVMLRMGENLPPRTSSELALPDAPDQSLTGKRDGVARGWLEQHTFKSEILGNERRVWVYTPPGYKESKTQDYPVLVAFDGSSALTAMPTHRILDNLLAEGRIRPMVAVLIDNATDTSRNDDLPCSEPFARFMETELLPWLAANYRVSDKPEDRAVTGASYGGLASMWFGYRLPHLFGTVISQAASLWWGPGWDQGKPMGDQVFEPEWLIDQYEASPKLPVRYWMEIGLMEHPSRMVDTNRRMQAVMQAKGYDLTYREPTGGHDYAVWRGTLGEALAAMLPAVG